MTFYFAAKYDKREQLLPIAAVLHAQGHQVIAEWLNGSHEGTSAEAMQAYARQDLADIKACDVFVLFQLPVEAPEPSTGRNVEFGYALSHRKQCVVVGSGSSVFYTLATRLATIEEFLACYGPASLARREEP